MTYIIQIFVQNLFIERNDLSLLSNSIHIQISNSSNEVFSASTDRVFFFFVYRKEYNIYTVETKEIIESRKKRCISPVTADIESAKYTYNYRQVPHKTQHVRCQYPPALQRIPFRVSANKIFIQYISLPILSLYFSLLDT